MTFDDLYDGMKIEGITLKGVAGTIRRRHGEWYLDYYIKEEAEDGHHHPLTLKVVDLTLKNIKEVL